MTTREKGEIEMVRGDRGAAGAGDAAGADFTKLGRVHNVAAPFRPLLQLSALQARDYCSNRSLSAITAHNNLHPQAARFKQRADHSL